MSIKTVAVMALGFFLVGFALIRVAISTYFWYFVRAEITTQMGLQIGLISVIGCVLLGTCCLGTSLRKVD